MLAAILTSGEPARLYTGLSLLVSTASAGEPARGLVTFGALEALLHEHGVPGASARGETFARSLAELVIAAAELPDCTLWACAAAVQTAGVDRAAVEARLAGVMGTPRFLRETAGARLVVV